MSQPEGPRKKARPATAPHVLVTGYPGFVAKPMVRRVLSSLPRARVTVLVEEKRRDDAETDLARMPVSARKRVRIATGDVRKMDLGLAGLEIESLHDVTQVLHLAALHSSEASARDLQAINVEGTRNLLALARELPGLQRFVHFSSCFVSGDRQGVILEDELDEVPAHRTSYEDSKVQGEKLCRAAMSELPITIVRPAIVVGDSETGEVDRFDGVYSLGILLVTSPISVPLPLPGPGIAPLNLVPVDYVTKATLHLAFDPRAVGKTFHLVDPNPLSARMVYELIAKRAGKKPPVPVTSSGSMAATLAASMANAMTTQVVRRVLQLPGLERINRAGPVRAADLFDRFVVYNASNTSSLLEGSGILCPRFDSYVEVLIQYVTESLRRAQRAKASPREPDPFDG